MVNLYHIPLFIKARSFARKIYLLNYIKQIISRRQKSYEEAFHCALRSSVRAGDTVWDVGANIGLYTKLFLELSGSNGRVVAFEPLPTAINVLKTFQSENLMLGNFTIVNVALSNTVGEFAFIADSDDVGVTTTGRLAEEDDLTLSSIKVEVTRADLCVQEKGVPMPTVVKIDVEGFEEEVLNGGRVVFSANSCREILVEMHFARMDERNLGQSASRIVSLLKSWGYCVRWVDASHIHAFRKK
jgi:FkbM family methyltransferase